MISYKLIVKGLVQGVGFRPYVAKLCNEFGISGNVYNAGGIVYINGNSSKEAMDELIHRLLLLDGANADLPLAHVTDVDVCPAPLEHSPTFSIIKSENDSEVKRLLPIDIATCPNCERELFDPANRRYRYPFISCASCGPRYSLMRSVPYDREMTAMSAFAMCPECEKEYNRIGDIRCYAQTIACDTCGPKLIGYGEGEEVSYKETAFSKATEILKKGGIVAIKDPTGYHLAFDAFGKANAGDRLRAYKNRENKPFAVMFDSVDTIRQYASINDKELELLENVARPIVLLDRITTQNEKLLYIGDEESDESTAFDLGVLKGSNRIGAMLPSNPLQLMLMKEFKALVMTSGNVSGNPIETEDGIMLEALKAGAIDYVLTNDRDILYGLDDSVLQVVAGHTQFLRRARGYVPLPVKISGQSAFVNDTSLTDKESDDVALALGGDMKASFAYGIGELAYLGGYYGDLSDYSCYNKWQESIKHMKQMLGLTGVDKTIGDLHPAYISAKEANVKIQHHYAHALSVMAEHGLKKALAVTFDGTGYGIDGAIWGGEFLLCDRQTESRNNSADEKEKKRGGGNVNTSDYNRIAHISPVRILGGDTSAKDCDIAAMSYIKEAIDRGYLAASDNPYADDTRWPTLSSAIDNNVNVITSTSMGRLFDAVSAMLGICTYNTYESEAPISLQIAAENWMRNGMLSKLAININYNESDGTYTADTVKLIANIVRLYNEGNDKGQLAFAFHKAVADLTVELIKCIYIERNIKNSDYPVTFSGGTMNNKLLLQLIIEQMRANALVYYINEQVEAGDGGLSLGQLYAVSNTIEF